MNRRDNYEADKHMVKNRGQSGNTRTIVKMHDRSIIL